MPVIARSLNKLTGIANEFRLVSPLLSDLDPDPAKQPAELAVFTARWTKPLPAPGVRVRYVPFPRKVANGLFLTLPGTP